jgi:putative lipoprotein (rSAM/lipoprotein system)
MRTLSHWLLRLCAFGTQIFIAACYGPPAGYRALMYGGKVVDADTKKPIAGVRVTCEQATGADGGLTDGPNVVTDSQGVFDLSPTFACMQLVAKDVDGALNGSYATAVLANPAPGVDLTISMPKQ